MLYSADEDAVVADDAEHEVWSDDSQHLDAEVAREHRKIASILAHSSEGIMLLDPSRRVYQANAALERMMGLTREEVVGKPCSDVLQIRDASGTLVCGKNCPLAVSREKTATVEGTLLNRSGENMVVELSCAVITAVSGEEAGNIVFVRDLTQLRHFEHLGSKLLAAVSHELQTPISVIKAYAGTLVRTDVEWNRETIQEKLLEIEDESNRLGELVNKLLTTSRLEARGLSLNKLWVDLHKQANRAAKSVAGEGNLHKFEIDFPPDFPPVYADPERLSEVLINLLDNAVKFSPEGGKITVRGEFSESEVIISVTDEGMGISPTDQESVFGCFYRCSDASAKALPGTGIGLYLCKTIVEAHGGRIWVESELGKGSRFFVSLHSGQE
jgi:PAS domain S-box-containing protein